MKREAVTAPLSSETTHQPDFEFAGSLQAVMKDITVRDYSLDLQQQEALEAIGHALIDGVPSGYIEMATSTGKTTIEALVAEAATKAGKRVLLLAPTVAIAKQIEGSSSKSPSGLARFADLPDSTKTRSHFASKQGNSSADIVVSTYSGFVSDAKNNHAKLGTFDVIIADECHRSLGKETSELLRTSMPNAFKLGLSATPDYAVNRKSEEVYGQSLYDFSLLEAVESGKTAPVRTLLYETNDTITVSEPQRDFTDRELAPLSHNAQRNGTALALTSAFVQEGRQGVIACIPGEVNLHARLMADLLRKDGIRALEVGAHLDTETQARRLQLYHNGEIDVLTFTRSLEEGWDSQRASFAINLAPTTSPVRTTQLLGRVLRKKPDGLDSVFVDFVDKKDGKTNKSQFTALHALGLEDIDITRTLGQTDSNSENWAGAQMLKSLHAISPEIYERLLQSQGKLLSEVSVGTATNSLQQEWERILEKEGLPADLHHNHALPPKLAQRIDKAYNKFLRNNGVTPTTEDLIEALGELSGPEKAILGSFALRSILNESEYEDRASEPDIDELNNPYARVVDNEMRETIKNVLKTLSAREAGVIEQRFGFTTADGEPATLSEAGKPYGIDRERARQIESKALSKLRHPRRSVPLRDYLDDTYDEPEGRFIEQYALPSEVTIQRFRYAVQLNLLESCFDGSASNESIRQLADNTEKIRDVIGQSAAGANIMPWQIRQLLEPFYRVMYDAANKKKRSPDAIRYDPLYLSVLTTLRSYY